MVFNYACDCGYEYSIFTDKKSDMEIPKHVKCRKCKSKIKLKKHKGIDIAEVKMVETEIDDEGNVIVAEPEVKEEVEERKTKLVKRKSLRTRTPKNKKKNLVKVKKSGRGKRKK